VLSFEVLIHGSPNEMHDLPENKIVDLIQIIRIIIEKKAIFIGINLVILLSGLAYYLITERYYEAELIAIQSDESDGSAPILQDSSFRSISRLVGIRSPSATSLIDVAIAILKSRSFLVEFVKEEKLMPELFSDQWDSQEKAWKQSIHSDEVPNFWDAYNLLSNQLSTSSDPDTGIITFSLKWSDPNLAASWLNTLVQRVNAKMKTDKLLETEQNISFLRSALDKARLTEVRNSISALLQSEIGAQMLTENSDEFALKVIDPAFPPNEHSEPRLLLVIFMSLFIGGFVSISLILWKETSWLT